jgi:uncharacterized protein (TIGR02246 family)
MKEQTILVSAWVSAVCVATFELLSPVEVGGVSTQDAEQEVRHVIEHFVQAWNKPNIEDLASMFAERAVLLTPSGHATTRPHILRLLQQEQMEFFEGRQLTLAIQSVVMGESHATVEGTYTLDGYTAAGFGSVPPGSIYFTLHKRGERWNIEKTVIER